MKTCDGKKISLTAIVITVTIWLALLTGTIIGIIALINWIGWNTLIWTIILIGIIAWVKCAGDACDWYNNYHR